MRRFALFTTPKHRFVRLLFNVGIACGENGRLNKLLETTVGMFSRKKLRLSLTTNGKIFITIICLNKFAFIVIVAVYNFGSLMLFNASAIARLGIEYFIFIVGK